MVPAQNSLFVSPSASPSAENSPSVMSRPPFPSAFASFDCRLYPDGIVRGACDAQFCTPLISASNYPTDPFATDIGFAALRHLSRGKTSILSKKKYVNTASNAPLSKQLDVLFPKVLFEEKVGLSAAFRVLILIGGESLDNSTKRRS